MYTTETTTTAKSRKQANRKKASFEFTVAELKVSYKKKVSAAEMKQVTCSRDVNEMLKSIYDEDTCQLYESFVALFLNRHNKVIGVRQISQGGLTGTVIDPRLLFGIALQVMATSVIISHNHPSGNLKPSDSDIGITRKISEIGKLHDIPLLDHIVFVGSDEYYSFADEGML